MSHGCANFVASIVNRAKIESHPQSDLGIRTTKFDQQQKGLTKLKNVIALYDIHGESITVKIATKFFL